MDLSEWVTPALSLACVYLLYKIAFPAKEDPPPPPKKIEPPPEPRKFTPEQLREFNGLNDKPIYVAIRGTVYDVSKGKDFYGPEGPYEVFAGYDASRAFAKFSTDKAVVENPDISDITGVERDQLDEWENKFKYWKDYPVVGKIVTPPTPREFTVTELRHFDGLSNKVATAASAPASSAVEGKLPPSIYVALLGQVFDVSYGGAALYLPGSGYSIFAGRDASRALAIMSLDQKYIDDPSIQNISESQRKTLDDWVTKFRDVKKYPIVGTLRSSE